MDGCLFCRIIKGEIPCSRVYEDDEVFAFHDISPQAPVHILVLPKKHIPDLSELKEDDAELMGKLVWAASSIAREKGFASSGFRLVVNTKESAGQSVFHLHMHLMSGRNFRWPPG